MYPQERVKCPRYSTEEPCEHYSGCTRQFEREVTICGFIHYDDRVTQFFSYAFRSSLSTGGTSSKGYAYTLSGCICICSSRKTNKK